MFYFDVELTGEDGQKLEPNTDNKLNTQFKIGNKLVPTTEPSGTGVGEHPTWYDASVTPARIRNVSITLGSNGSGSVTIDGLPVGTTYKVLENSYFDLATSGMIAQNIALDANASTGKSGAIPANAATQAETFTNIRKKGNLSIEKVVNNTNVASETLPTFTVQVELKTKNGKQPIAITADDEVPITRQQGTATPTTDSSYFTTGADGIGTITVNAGETVTIGDADADGVGHGIPTDVVYMITELGVPEFSKTYEVKASGTGSYAAIGVGGADILAGTISESRVTNTRLTGNLIVGKTVNSKIPSDANKYFEYEVEITGPRDVKVEAKQYGTNGMTFSNAGDGNSVATFSLKSGETITATGLPVGVTYTVTEKRHTDDVVGGVQRAGIDLDKFITTWTRTVNATTPDELSGTGVKSPTESSGSTNTIFTDDSTVAFVNTRKTTDLKLIKELVTPFNTDKNDLYTFEVQLKHGDESLTGPFTVNTYNSSGGSTSSSVTFDANGKARIDVMGKTDKFATIQGVPLDTTYTVTEILNTTQAQMFDKSDDVVATVSQSSGQMPAAVEATITNTRKAVPVSILKVSALDPETKLAGAVFTLTPVVPSGGTSPVEWTSKELVSDANGYLTDTAADPDESKFNLPSGTYQLEELKAPTGYHKLSRTMQFTVTASGVSYTDSITGNNHSVEVVDDANLANRVVHINVSNSTGTELPSTGGPGTAALYVAGCTLIALAGIAALRQRKTSR